MKYRIRNRLRDLMTEKEIPSLIQISRDTGLSYQTLWNFYHQKFDVFNGRLIAALCDYLDCEVSDLIVLEKVA